MKSSSNVKPYENFKEYFLFEVKTDFPDCHNILSTYLTTGIGDPIFYSHVPILIETFGREIDISVEFEITQFYVYLSSYYMLQDQLVDEQTSDKFAPLIAGLIISRATNRLERLCSEFLAPDEAKKTISYFHKSLSDNFNALRLEHLAYTDPTQVDNPSEYQNVVERANSVTFLLFLLGRVVNKEVSNNFLSAIRSFIFVSQMGDNLCDWREDYHSQKWTLFLRKCLSAAGRISNEEELEEFVYLSGIYEEECINIMRAIVKVRDSIADDPSCSDTNLIQYLHIQHRKAFRLLTTFCEKKSIVPSHTRERVDWTWP